MGNIKVIVAAHKQYWMPSDPIYMPLQVGSAGKPSLGYIRDDTGDQISRKNPNYCELTGLYWAWKNLEADYIGLVHYRRYFANPEFSLKKEILCGDDLEKLLLHCNVLLPKERHYFIETNYSQYVHAHHSEDLVFTRAVIADLCPTYLDSYDRSMSKTHGHRFNMFVMRRDVFCRYCDWLFGILFELEKRLDISEYSPYDARVFGFISERLLDVWMDQEKIAFRELPVLNLESQHWPRKITQFLCRKIKYSGK